MPVCLLQLPRICLHKLRLLPSSPAADLAACPLLPAACLVQGRDDIGRPLLQRALRVQEAHLGPDHPDVMAIRDVLLEDG